MKVSIYLHPGIVELLTNFGTLPEVINRIVDETIDNTSIATMPPAPNRGDARRYNINITNKTYETLVRTYGPNSTYCSIRRLIYWFVDNEMYDELGWNSIEYNDKVKEYISNRLYAIRQELVKLHKCTNYEAKEILKQIDELTTKLEVMVNGEPNK